MRGRALDAAVLGALLVLGGAAGALWGLRGFWRQVGEVWRRSGL